MAESGPTPGFRIEAIREEHIESFRSAVDTVARERRYLVLLEAPPTAETRAFVLGNLREGNPQVVAVTEGDAAGPVVGWCDIVRAGRPALRHGGALGIGVLPAFRGRGLGAALLRDALALARERGFRRVELVVRADNARALALYERAGFEHEGLLRSHLCIDGEFHASRVMALLL